MKNFLTGLLVALVFSLAAVAQAEEVDPYFAWKIKNHDGYAQSNFAVYGNGIKNMTSIIYKENDTSKFFAYDMNISDIDGTRNKLYRKIISGKYSEAATFCEMIAARQKIIFGTDFFDESLTELTAKLYLITDELDKAERKINFLTENSYDDLTKIRALNLKSDLLNHNGHYHDALQVTQEVDELLLRMPDEKLSLINQARAAQAYCGLGELQKSAELVEKLYPKMQETFGKTDLETLALMSTVAENCLKTQRHSAGLKILINKYQSISDRYGTDNLVLLSKAALELANYCFAIKDNAGGEEFLESILTFATKYVHEENNHEAFHLYKLLNETATKYLDGDNPITLKSELGLAHMSCRIGNIPQSIELCKKNLPQLKKTFGKHGDETLQLMTILGEDYLLLGNYSDAKKIIDERLKVCKKNFGKHDARTIKSTIDLANVFYRMGKYKTADKLLADIDLSQNKELFKNNTQLTYDMLFSKYFGDRMKGNNIIEHDNFLKTSLELEEKGSVSLSDSLNLELETLKFFSILGGFSDVGYNELGLMNVAKLLLSEYHPKILEVMNAIIELHIEYGELQETKRYANQSLELTEAHFGKENLCEWRALTTLAKIRRAEKHFPAAFEYDERALQIAETVCGKNSLERFQSLDAVASDRAGEGKLTEAIQIREQALSEYKKILEDTDALTIQIMINLAEDYVAAKRYDDAIKLCDETLGLLKVPVYVGNQIFAHNSVIELFRIKAQAQRLSGDDINAYENYKKLIQVYEGQRASSVKVSSSSENKSRWFEKVMPAYKAAAAVAASNKIGDTDFAFYCMEFCKGRNLIDRYDDILIAGNYLLTAQDKNILTEYEKLVSACQVVSEYAKTTNDDELRFSAEITRMDVYFAYDLFKRMLREKYSANMIAKYDSEQNPAVRNRSIWNWETILANFDVGKNRQAIPYGACLIEFMKVSDDLLLVTFLRNEGDVQAANIPVDPKFFEDCQLYHKFNAHADERKVAFEDLRKNISVKLSEDLMPTLEKFAGSSSCWIISPDAELNLVPFETLIYRDKLLIESKDVSYVPSLAVMNLMRNRERKNSYLGRNKELFAMGDAIYGVNGSSAARGNRSSIFNKKWTDLPGTAQELDKVSSLFENKTIFRREQATEKNLRELNTSGELSKYKYLLFATHGMFVPDKPEYSSIVLGQQGIDEDNDGYVTVGEWMGYDLRSNLIYLSACESGLGVEQAGEGIVGIPYALTVAGNKDTVMSLWKVKDAATAEFTSAVFEKLRRGQSEISALNETKREFLKHDNPSYRNPSVWAAFVLYGI